MSTKDLHCLRLRVQEIASYMKEQENLRMQVSRQLKRKTAKPVVLSKSHVVNFRLV